MILLYTLSNGILEDYFSEDSIDGILLGYEWYTNGMFQQDHMFNDLVCHGLPRGTLAGDRNDQ